MYAMSTSGCVVARFCFEIRRKLLIGDENDWNDFIRCVKFVSMFRNPM